MKIDYKNPAELQKLIPADLAALYELGNLKDMEAELKANGWLVAGTLSKDGIPIDCYRRLKVAVKLGIKKVGVFAPIVNDTAADKKLYVWIPMQTIDVLDKLDQGIEKIDPFAKNEIVDLDNADSSLPYTRIERIVTKSFKYTFKSLYNPSNNRNRQLYCHELDNFIGDIRSVFN